MIAFAPLNRIFGIWKKLVDKLFKVSSEQGYTEDELKTIVEEPIPPVMQKDLCYQQTRGQ